MKFHNIRRTPKSKSHSEEKKNEPQAEADQGDLHDCAVNKLLHNYLQTSTHDLASCVFIMCKCMLSSTMQLSKTLLASYR